MKKFSALLSLLVIVLTAVYAEVEHSDDDAINHVNQRFRNRTGGWQAKRNHLFGRGKHEKLALLGAEPPLPENIDYHVPPPEPPTAQKRSIFPSSFDARTRWTTCNAIISDVRNQAHVAASVISDRTCIASASQNVIRKIAVEDLISCMPPAIANKVTQNPNLCNGFNIRYAFQMYLTNGIVTGGELNTTIGCMPYVSYGGSANIFNCRQTCSNNAYPVPYAQDKTFGTEILAMGYSFAAWNMNGLPLSANRAYTFNSAGQIIRQNPMVDTVENLMKQEIMTNGPIGIYFDVYYDFFSYSSGVYQRTSSSYAGGHALKVIGWGVEGGTPYWQAVNSWGTLWGDKGFVKILRGSNHCNIENYVVSAIPRTTPPVQSMPTSAPHLTTSSVLSTVALATSEIQQTNSSTLSTLIPPISGITLMSSAALSTITQPTARTTQSSSAAPSTMLPSTLGITRTSSAVLSTLIPPISGITLMSSAALSTITQPTSRTAQSSSAAPSTMFPSTPGITRTSSAAPSAMTVSTSGFTQTSSTARSTITVPTSGTTFLSSFAPSTRFLALSATPNTPRTNSAAPTLSRAPDAANILSTTACKVGTRTTGKYFVPNSATYTILNGDTRFAIQSDGQMFLLRSLRAGHYKLLISTISSAGHFTYPVTVSVNVNC